MQDTALVRPARPGDVEAVAPLLCAPRPGLVDVLGDPGRALRAASKVFSSSKAIDGHRFCTVAELDGEVVGVISAIPAERWEAARVPSGLAMIAAAPLAALSVIRRGRIMERLTPPCPEESLYISCLALQGELRGKGIGQRLLDEVVSSARAARRSRVVLDVGMDNHGAIRFYQRRGFVEIEQRTTTESERRTLSVTGQLRMELRLD